MLQKPIPLLPEGAKPINEYIAIHHEEGGITFLNASSGIFKCSGTDHYGLRLAQGVLCPGGRGRTGIFGKSLAIACRYPNRRTIRDINDKTSFNVQPAFE